MTKRDVHKKVVIEALTKCLGVESHACKMANISRETYYRWKREDEKFANEVNNIANITIDFAESMLHKKIREGDTTAIIFFLKTKGRNRGYVERHELIADLVGKQDITIKIVRGNSIET